MPKWTEKQQYYIKKRTNTSNIEYWNEAHNVNNDNCKFLSKQFHASSIINPIQSNPQPSIRWLWSNPMRQGQSIKTCQWGMTGAGRASLPASPTTTRNSSGDEIANVNFLYDDIVHVLQNTIDSCINSAPDPRSGYMLERMFTKFSEITQCNGHYAVQGNSRSPILVPIESSYTTSY